MSLLAIDIGSSACKAVAFSVEGEILAQHACAYTPDFPRPGFAEMDVERFWQTVCSCCQSVAKNLGDPVQALCLSSHGETFVPVNAQNQAIAPAILNQDNRAAGEAGWIEQQIGRKRLFEITGLVAHPMYPLAKILWLREHQPDIFSSASAFITVVGYILLRMGLPPQIDYSLASRYLAFDVQRRCWSDDILSAVDLPAEKLPAPVPAGTVIGKLNASTASQLGLPSGISVVIGGHDQPCGALGVGVVGRGKVSDSIGTYECLLAASESPALNETALAACLNSYCHVVPGKFVTIAYFPSGIMMKWFHDLLFTNGTGNMGALPKADHYSDLEAHVSLGPSGLCVMPHLIGTCHPDFNPNARGMIAGLSTATTRGQIYKGILEGLACELAEITRVLARAVGEFQDIYATGGGSRSQLGLQLRAALTGKSFHVMRCPEAVCLGGAILAGVACHEFESIEQAVEQVVRTSATVVPDPAMAAAYAQQLKRYQRVRSSVPEMQF